MFAFHAVDLFGGKGGNVFLSFVPLLHIYLCCGVFFCLFACFGVIPIGIPCFLALHSDGVWGLNPTWLCTRQVPYLLSLQSSKILALKKKVVFFFLVKLNYKSQN